MSLVLSCCEFVGNSIVTLISRVASKSPANPHPHHHPHHHPKYIVLWYVWNMELCSNPVVFKVAWGISVSR